jgi:hypothetical protein
MGVKHQLNWPMSAFIGLMFGLLLPHPIVTAADNGCGKPELRAEGRRSDPGSSEEKERDARTLSISKWQQLAQELYGNLFADWRLARERKIECERYDRPGFNGRVSCVAIGLPCDRR